MIDILMWIFFLVITFGTLVALGLAVLVIDEFIKMVRR